MAVYRDDNKKNTWVCKFSYLDCNGKRRNTTKRGFTTKRDALAYEHDFMAKVNNTTGMLFKDFVEIYLENMKSRIKESTMMTKISIIESEVLPFFGDMQLNNISSKDIIIWQNELLKKINEKTGETYKRSYLKTIHNQLNAILNFAVKYYDLPKNPARVVGNMGSEDDIEMKFWTLEQYKQFAEEIMEKPIYYYCFQVLYWCGLREGEMLALSTEDIDLDKKIIRVNKTYMKLNGKDMITSPKTKKSNREVVIPAFLAEELREYKEQIYDLNPTARFFPLSKSTVIKALKTYAEKAGLPEIRVHDLRHSHVSLLINLGYSAVAIAERVGHESVHITYRYAHVFPQVQNDMAKRLNALEEGEL